MAGREENGRTYAALANAYGQRGEPGMRDRFLVLAADAALAAGQPNEAEKLRRQLLQTSPHHLLKPYASFAEAATAPDLAAYIHDLRENYPPEAAARLLTTLKTEAAANAAPNKPDSSRPLGAKLKPQPPSAPVESRPPTPPLDVTQPPPRMEPAIYRMRDAAEDDDILNEPPRSDIAATMPPTRRRADPAMTLPPGAQPALPRPAPRTNRPVPAPTQGPRRSEPMSDNRSPLPMVVSDDEVLTADGSWLGSLLFGIVLTAGFAWLAVTLARPFLWQ